MRPGKQRWGVETGRREPYPCPACRAPESDRVNAQRSNLPEHRSDYQVGD